MNIFKRYCRYCNSENIGIVESYGIKFKCFDCENYIQINNAALLKTGILDGNFPLIEKKEQTNGND